MSRKYDKILKDLEEDIKTYGERERITIVFDLSTDEYEYFLPAVGNPGVSCPKTWCESNLKYLYNLLKD